MVVSSCRCSGSVRCGGLLMGGQTKQRETRPFVFREYTRPVRKFPTKNAINEKKISIF
jgi:hypothetical protein